MYNCLINLQSVFLHRDGEFTLRKASKNCIGVLCQRNNHTICIVANFPKVNSGTVTRRKFAHAPN